MKTIPRFISYLCMAMAVAQANPLYARTRTVGYLVLSERYTHEDSAVVRWLKDSRQFVPKVVRIGERPPSMQGLDIVWVHIPDSAAYQSWTRHLRSLDILPEFYRKGGRILFTDYAAMIPYELGIESAKPELRSFDIKDDWLFDQTGLQSFRGHPVFDGLFGGTFLWDPNEDQRLPAVGYFDRQFPDKGKVVGVGKSYVFLHPDRKVMVEYSSGRGRILSIGSGIYFGRDNNRRLNLERFLRNCLVYLSGGKISGPVTYWEKAECQPKPMVVSSKPLGRSAQRTLTALPQTELLLSRESPHNEFYDVAGRRALVMGYENGGIDELWVHPFRVLRNYDVGLVFGDSIAWLKHMPLRIDVRPESFTRTYRTPVGRLTEIVFSSLTKPGAVVHYEVESAEPVHLVLKYRCDLRFMWPYDERTLGDVFYGYDGNLGALHVRDNSGDFYCVLGADVLPVKHLSGQYADITWRSGELSGTVTEANQVFHASEYELNKENGYVLNVALVGTDQGKQEALREYRSLLLQPADVYAEVVEHYRRLLESSVTIASPDPEFNALFKWALIGTDRFVATTPRLGTALVAGFATTARGWNGEHIINGRPGYAWYFGRDSEWSGLAIDDYGDFPTVKAQLEFLQKYQDLSGKIFHELSTSGVVHYDAADATPLYVILAAHYLRASGDLSFIKKNWPYLKKAMDFLYSTDTDGDGLIENTNVGHGWVEGGKLFPVHTEFYLAGLWARALKDAAFMASQLGENRLRDTYAADEAKVEKILNKDFWNPMTVAYNFGKKKDGTYNYEPTVLPAPVMYLDVLDKTKVQYALERYAGSGFSTDWGVRIVGSLSTLFNPQGYHYGSIWPLFTGWTALAEYQYGNSAQGFTHMMNNMLIKNHWALGFVEEVINGAVYKPTGVCPHQCWSETNVLHPAIAGMIGWKPDATTKSARLLPRFPLHWDTVTVTNLRVGKSQLQLHMERSINRTRYQFRLLQGDPVTIAFAPEIPEGMVITEALLNRDVVVQSFAVDRGVLAQPIVVPVSGVSEVELNHTGGVGMIPVVPRPQPGDSSLGYRIVRAQLKDRVYTIDVDGRSGTTATVEARIFDWGVPSVEGARIEGGRADKGIVRFRVPFGPSRTGFSRATVSVRVEEK